MRSRLAAMQNTFPGRVLVISEFGAESNDLNPGGAPGSYSYQSRLLAEHIAVYAADHQSLTATTIWLLRDYPLNPTFQGGSIKKKLPHLKLIEALSQKGLQLRWARQAGGRRGRETEFVAGPNVAAGPHDARRTVERKTVSRSAPTAAPGSALASTGVTVRAPGVCSATPSSPQSLSVVRIPSALWAAISSPVTTGERGWVEVYQLLISRSTRGTGLGDEAVEHPPPPVLHALQDQLLSVLRHSEVPPLLVLVVHRAERDRVEQRAGAEADVGVPGSAACPTRSRRCEWGGRSGRGPQRTRASIGLDLVDAEGPSAAASSRLCSKQ